jgi:hypothetical protein
VAGQAGALGAHKADRLVTPDEHLALFEIEPLARRADARQRGFVVDKVRGLEGA